MTDANKTRYLLMREVVDAAIENGGTIFGGYVRDFIIHEHNAKKFFEEVDDDISYTDPSVSPDTYEGRMLVANDIDIHFKTDAQFFAFRKELNRRSFSVGQRRRRFGGYMTRHCWTLHLKLVLNIQGVSGSTSFCLLKNQMKDVERVIPGSDFCVDVVVDNENEPPFSEDSLDFGCNGLIMNASGISLCEQLSSDGRSAVGNFRLLQSIMDDIVKKRAYAMKFDAYRWKKMDEKKTWEILGDRAFVNKKTNENEECVICHVENAQYKLTCCNAFYHLDCLKKTLHHDHSRCAHCRRELYLGEEKTKFFAQ